MNFLNKIILSLFILLLVFVISFNVEALSILDSSLKIQSPLSSTLAESLQGQLPPVTIQGMDTLVEAKNGSVLQKWWEALLYDVIFQTILPIFLSIQAVLFFCTALLEHLKNSRFDFCFSASRLGNISITHQTVNF